MTKIELLVEIDSMIALMQPPLLRIKRTILIFKNSEEQYHNIILEGYQWLYAIYSKEFHTWKQVRKCVSEKVWERYVLYGTLQNYQEGIALLEAEATLRKAITMSRRPTLFKKGAFNAALKTRKKRERSQNK